MKIKDISIKYKIIVFALILSIIPVTIIGLYAYNEASISLNKEVQNKLEEQVKLEKDSIETTFTLSQNNVNSSLGVAKAQFYSRGKPSISDGKMQLGENYVVNGNFEIVDSVKNMVGGTATVFQVIGDEAVRVSTNVINTDGSRAVGTKVSKPVYDAVIMRGETYYGRAWVVNAWYLSAYEPIKDSSGKTIGILYVGVPEDPFINLIKQKMKDIVVGETGYLYVIDSKGNLIIHPNREGENLLEYDFIKKITETKEGYIEYPWEGRDKVVAYTYYEPRDWIIASGSYIDDFNGPIKAIRNGLILAILFFSIVGSVFGMWFSKTITKPINAMLKVSNKVASGDLTVKLNSRSKDEIGQLFAALGIMTQNMRDVLGKVQRSAFDVASTAQQLSASSEEMKASSDQISNTTQDIAKGVSQQSSKMAQVSNAMKSMSESVQQVASNSERAAQGATAASTTAQQVGKMSGDVASKMTEIRSTVDNSAIVIKQLDGKSQQIGEIISVITNIADQTNLLALNAAIEAARAGEHGRGFAVVAEEVRKLAEESGKAANQITALIKDIQQGTQKAVVSMEQGTKTVGEGSKTIGETVTAINQIVEAAADVAAMVQEIAAAAKQQSVSVEEVTSSVEDLSAISEQSAAGTQETSAAAQEQTASMDQLVNAAQELAKLSEELQAEVNKFKLDNVASAASGKDKKVQERTSPKEPGLKDPGKTEGQGIRK
ncbi:MAG: hypothetical protein C3F06_00870 [Candidatus Methanoperedenaceae archaeon]|nr:MAG: hypothetical protein C3F06_00870 [Candidatus Methanoperedenaceae archaeon]